MTDFIRYLEYVSGVLKRSVCHSLRLKGEKLCLNRKNWTKSGTGLTINSVSLRVKDVMSSPVITVKEAASVEKAAQLMGRYNIGCIIVADDGGMPLGIITERDLALRVVAKNLRPQKVPAREVMSSPLIAIDSDQPITEAARQMNRFNIRRLVVVREGKLIGIVTSKDITAVMPALIEVIEEYARANKGIISSGSEAGLLVGYCESCLNWSDTLKKMEGRNLCEACVEG